MTETKKVKYHEIVGDSLVDGKGLRVAIFVPGCSHNCEGCHNKELQDPNNYQEITMDGFASKLLEYMNPLVDGFTLTGGDPMFNPNNANRILHIINGIKEDNQDVWLYTGYEIERLPYEILDKVDFVVDGKYEKDLPEALYRGSDNQCIWKKVIMEDDKVCFKDTTGRKEFFSKTKPDDSGV